MHLLGPVFRFNLVRVARQKRHFIIRVIYAALLFALFLAMRGAYQAYTTAGSPALVANLMANFSEQFFLLLLGQQALMVLALTPGCVATALCEEKQSRQLELLLTTDVRVAEIVLGKLLARLGQIVLLVLASLPILSLMQFFGGVEPALVWAGYAGTLVLVFSLGSVSMLCSLYSTSTPGAVTKSYLVPLTFVFMGWGLPLLHDVIVWSGGGPAEHALVEEALRLHHAGDPFAVVADLRHHVQTVGSLGTRPWELLGNFTLFHGTIILVGLAWTILRIRQVYLRHVAQDQLPAHRRRLLPRQRLKLHERPIFWKECRSNATGGWGVLWRVVSLLGGLGVLVGGLLLIVDAFGEPEVTQKQLHFNNYLRVVGPVLLGIVLLQIGVGAASSLHVERHQLTWDSLVMTLIPLRGILAGKWWGSIYATRFLLSVLALLIVMGVLAGGLHPVTAVLLAGITALGCAFTATVGIHNAVRCRTHFRAVMQTLCVILVLNVGLPLLSPMSWAYRCEGMYFYPAPPDWKSIQDILRRRTLISQTPAECEHRETWLAALLKSSSPVNSWQLLALTGEEVEQGQSLLRARYEWEEARAIERHSRWPYFLRYPVVHYPWKSLPERLFAVALTASVWFLLDWWLWRRAVRRLMLELERVDEYPIRYWHWPPGA